MRQVEQPLQEKEKKYLAIRSACWRCFELARQKDEKALKIVDDMAYVLR